MFILKFILLVVFYKSVFIGGVGGGRNDMVYNHL